VLFIAELLVMATAGLPAIRLFAWILNIAALVLVVLGIMNAANGKKTPLPIIGKFADRFTF
jgi:uncharacterized membrane protein